VRVILGGVSIVTALALSLGQAAAHARQHSHLHSEHWRAVPHPKQAEAAWVRYGGRPGLGYWRPGPASGYGFGFSTYKGDPFGSDDYWDGGRCYYRLHHDFCGH
jgi:hypothetical protein